MFQVIWFIQNTPVLQDYATSTANAAYLNISAASQSSVNMHLCLSPDFSSDTKWSTLRPGPNTAGGSVSSTEELFSLWI